MHECVLKADPDELGIKRRELSNLFFSLQVGSFSNLLSISVSIQRHLRRHSYSATS